MLKLKLTFQISEMNTAFVVVDSSHHHAATKASLR